MKTFINVFVFLVSSNFSLAGTGFIEISGNPGFSVVLGDEPKGVLGKNPLMLSGINVGRHNLTFLKQGYQRVDHVVEVSENSVTQISITASDPGVSFSVSQPTELLSQRKVGWMDITTWPAHCKLEIVGENWARSDIVKVASTHRANNLPEGVYKIMATAEGIKAQGELQVVDGEQSACFINLEESRFIDLRKELTKVEQAERQAARALYAAEKATEERLATEKAARSSREENERLLQEFERLKAEVEAASQGRESKEGNEEFSRMLQEFERLKSNIETVSQKGESRERSEKAAERMMFIDGESNFRTGPSTGTEILYQPANGSPGTVIKREGSWIQIRLDNGDVGWAYESNLKPVSSGASK